MWLLVHCQPRPSSQSGAIGETAWCLLPGREYSVGRIGCDLTTVWEQSVSKKHAIILVHATQGTLTLKDVSTFGTFINDRKVQNENETIEDGDQIILGLRSDISGTYTLRWRPVVLCCSQMGPSELLSFKATAINSHIIVLDAWDVTVTHLVVGELKTTQKVMCALAKGVPVVGVGWVESLIDSINKLNPIPLPSDHLPTLGRTCRLTDVTLFRSDVRRAKLFEGKRFYFLDSLEYQQLSIPVSYCGGTSTLVDVSDVTFATFDRYASPDAVVVSGKKDRFCSVPGGTEFISLLELTVEEAGRTLVQESEIIHSIMNVATATLFSQPLSPSPLHASNLSQRDLPSQSPKKLELSQGASSCMLSLFDEENINQDYPNSQSEHNNQNIQLLPAGKRSRLTSIIRDTVVKCELSADTAPSVTPYENQDATCHTSDWISRDEQVSPAHTPYQSQDDLNEEKKSYRILRKCFVKTPLCSRKYEYLKPFIRVTANSDTVKTEPMPFSSDEEFSEQEQFSKTRIASIYPLTKSQAIPIPKCKRKSSENLQTTQKKSLIIIRDDSDSDDEKYLAVTPLD